MNSPPIRCQWVNQDPEYIAYHDNEWGKPTKDNQQLFEMICLEGQQAGLSWYTILKKRQNYRELFHQFDPKKVALMTEGDVERLMQDPRIIRNRAKINAIIANAKAYLQMAENGEEFSSFIWQFVNNQPIVNQWRSSSQVPAETELSKTLSKALKKRGFKFVGSITCYAFMQATGMINDHLMGCCQYK
ncbi:DNA-3-methyladenine glycosylase I [Providencia stuartii]|uniref:DNA-3-methyladenine glycosylase I n=1 Tax=Providencia stuartii TaxID=588 RepID=A0AAI9DE46_PROST|nr:DNA-3-methyladenine glycosylase I [Providencia sp. 2023EL-00965]ELR5038885.1 DNA-3-methyladenine glycosylase I [Providencia stuartii]MDV5227390.1 DNA-3-methyladenine glycosylase I [Providencia rettgeri]ELR5083037.1 DNA-3-methyladenine glycosylase I [Providencia stuartii]ELR5113924.1 DNA-3-methyladenine glycosylase I [Providencia stuartii]ELR5299904.1 DNA-3-methyladenine glycosylase I [Providencia stuartii]